MSKQVEKSHLSLAQNNKRVRSSLRLKASAVCALGGSLACEPRTRERQALRSTLKKSLSQIK